MSFSDYFLYNLIDINVYTENPLNFTYKFNDEDKVNVVISRYAENIDNWINTFKNVYLFDKSKNNNKEHYLEINPNINYEHLENVGRCDHSYIYYIINNYDNLNDMTLFLPASFRNNNYKIILLSIMIMIHNDNPGKSIFFKSIYSIRQMFDNFILTHHRTTSLDNRTENGDVYETQLCEEIPYSNWLVKNLGDVDTYLGSFGGILLIHKNDIRSRPKSFYENLIKYLDKYNNPLAGHYIERSWSLIFNINDDGYEFEKYFLNN